MLKPVFMQPRHCRKEPIEVQETHPFNGDDVVVGFKSCNRGVHLLYLGLGLAIFGQGLQESAQETGVGPGEALDGP